MTRASFETVNALVNAEMAKVHGQPAVAVYAAFDRTLVILVEHGWTEADYKAELSARSPELNAAVQDAVAESVRTGASIEVGGATLGVDSYFAYQRRKARSS